MARRTLLHRGAPLASSSLPFVQSLRTFVTAHASQKHVPSSSSCLSRCSSPVSKFSRQLHSATCTRVHALRLSISPRTMWSVPVASGLTTDAAPAADVTPEDVLHYWFKDADLANNTFPMQFWFFGGEAADKEVNRRAISSLPMLLCGDFPCSCRDFAP